MPEARQPRPQRVLILEFWGMGDAVMATAFFRGAPAGVELHAVVKPAWAPLLAASHPGVVLHPFNAPWTAFRGKYRLHRWPWRALATLIGRLRRLDFDAGVSVRPDPRDHKMLALCGVRRRIGFGRLGSGIILNPSLSGALAGHRVEDWWALGRALWGGGFSERSPALPAVPRVRGPRPRIGLHLGAGQPVRRWPLESWRGLAKCVRAAFDGEIVLFTDLDGYGGGGAVPDAAITENHTDVCTLASELGACDLLIAHDSGPGHVAAAAGVPVVTIFGSQVPGNFRPFGGANAYVSGLPCRYKPCRDYCRYEVPVCITDLSVDAVWDVVRLRMEALGLLRT